MINIISANIPNKSQLKLSFGRAFTKNEMDVYQKKLAEAFELQEINDPCDDNKSVKSNNRALILPDFYAPDKTLNSEEAIKYVLFMKALTGINTVQALPRGPVTKTNLSPFSSSPFELGEHLIDSKKLTDKFGSDDLKTVYENTKDSDEFATFKEKNSHLERYGMLDALKKEYGTDYWHNWKGKNADLDKNLFNYEENIESNINEELKKFPAKKDGEEEKIKQQREKLEKELKELKDKKARQKEIKEKYAEDIDFYMFKQHVGLEQHKETKQELNDKDIKLFGDCLIGFSYRDEWAFKSAFEPGKTLGAQRDDKGFQDWDTPCLDFNKIQNSDGSLGTAGKVLKKKFDVFFDNYDGARIDAGWQLSHCLSSKSHDRDGNDNLIPEYLGNKLLDVMEMALDDQREKGHNVQSEDINIETLGGPGDSVLLTKNRYPHIHHSRYEKDDWGRLGFYNSNRNGNYHESTNAGYKLTGITFGPDGCHDDRSSIDISNTERDSQSYFLAEAATPKSANDSEIDKYNEKVQKLTETLKGSPEEFRNAKNAEAYMARNNFITASNAVGDERRLNNPDNSSDPNNWTINIKDKGRDCQKYYFKNLSEGKGLNAPKSLAMAIRKTMGENDRTRSTLEFLDKAGRILRQGGPATIEKATELEKTNKSQLGEMIA